MVAHEIRPVGDQIERRVGNAVLTPVGFDAAAKSVATLKRQVDDGPLLDAPIAISLAA